MQFNALPRNIKINLLIQIGCMLGACTTHLIWIVENGIYTQRQDVAFGSTIFWDSLSFVDFIAAMLLYVKPRIGIITTLIIISFDVVHNNLYLFLKNQHINSIGLWNWSTEYWMMICQILFLIFVFFSFKRNIHILNTLNTKST